MVSAVQLTTLANYGANVMTGAWLDQTFVEALHANLVATPLGRSEIPAPHTSTTIRWQIHETGVGAAAGTEGADPSDVTYTTTTAEDTLEEYNGSASFSKLLVRSAMSATIQELVKEVGYAASKSIEDKTHGALGAATNINNEGTALSAESIRTAVSELEANDAKPHPMTPGGKYYCFIVSPAAAYDMMGEGAPTWFQAKSSDYQAALQTPFSETEATAAIYKTIVKTSTAVSTAGGDDEMYLIAKDAFGSSYLDGDFRTPKVHVTMPDEMVSAPARNRGSVGYAVFYACIIIDNNRLVEVLADT